MGFLSFKVTALLACACLMIGNSIASKEENSTGVSISKKHIIVWFDYSVRYYDHEADNAYSKNDLWAMVKVVSRRFTKLAIDVAPVQDTLPPPKDAHSRIWIPEVVAERNLASPSEPPMEVLVSYDVAKIARTKEVTSFDVAKYMADTANQIFPGTVKTLMMYTGFSIFSAYYNTKDTVQQLKVAREKINGNYSNSSTVTTSFKYDLAVFLDLKDCGHFKGTLGQKAKDFLPHVEIIVTLLRPNYHQMGFNPEILHKMFVTKFEDCEKKLKKEKPEIRVIPSVLWMAKKGSSEGMSRCWQMMSDWGKKNDKEVIMFEAFDTPHGHLLSDQGWWRLKDRAEHEIREDGFVEKISEKGSKKDQSSNTLSLWDDSDEGDNDSSSPTSSAGLLSAAENNATSGSSTHALYIVIVLLTVICFLLVAVIVGLVYGFRNMLTVNNSYSNNRSILHSGSSTSSSMTTRRMFMGNGDHNHDHTISSREEEDETDSCHINGAVLEIRDTAPIVAVTYKK